MNAQKHYLVKEGEENNIPMPPDSLPHAEQLLLLELNKGKTKEAGIHKLTSQVSQIKICIPEE